MIIGIPKEIKNQEYRVGLTPSQVKNLVGSGHQVLVEKTAGNGVGFDDDSYQIAGAVIIEAPDEIFKEAQMIVKVKEPLQSEWPFIRRAATRLRSSNEATILAAFTVTANNGRLFPVLSCRN